MVGSVDAERSRYRAIRQVSLGGSRGSVTRSGKRYGLSRSRGDGMAEKNRKGGNRLEPAAGIGR